MDNASQSSSCGRGKCKRFWSKDEIEALLDELVAMKSDPQWKVDSGFRNGFMVHLEKRFAEKFPGCGLKAVPHIESKYKWFKDKYSVINDMLRMSGFKWNEQSKMIECEKQAYDDFCKGHPKAGGLWKTSFPYLDQLDLIFGLDRATGADVEDIEESIQNLENECINLDNDVDDSVFGEDNCAYEIPSEPLKKKLKKDSGPKGINKKDGAEVIMLNKMCDAFSGAVSNMNSHLEKIASVMSSAHDREKMAQDREMAEAELKRNLLTQIGKLPGLKVCEAIKAARVIGATPSLMNAFYSSPNDDRKVAVVYDALGND